MGKTSEWKGPWRGRGLILVEGGSVSRASLGQRIAPGWPGIAEAPGFLIA